jgi:hypothetical protein
VKREELIRLFSQLGRLFNQLANDESWKDYESGLTEDEYIAVKTVVNKQFIYNGWFTKESVQFSLLHWSAVLNEKSLKEWTSQYSFSSSPKGIAIIMAGNIPLVGFHDFLTAILSGNKALCKYSSDDKTMLPAFIDILIKWNPEFAKYACDLTGKKAEIEGVIATGSDNSSKFFEQYFGKYPHVFRRNRTSVAVLTGKESHEQMHELGMDIFTYFGLGCRNVSLLFVPKGYEVAHFFEGMFDHKDIIYHKKYGNNYDYNKAIFLMNKHKLFDNNFVLLRESDDLFSPLAMVHFKEYETMSEVEEYIKQNENKIQAIVGENHVPFGVSQKPDLMHYADNVDTFAWLNTLQK